MLRLLILIFIGIQVVIPGTVSRNDPRDYAVIGGRQYYFSDVPMAQAEAREFCRSLSMDLIALESQQEHDDVTTYVQTVLDTPSTDYVTSGIKSYTSFIWSSTGVGIGWDNWGYAEPSDTSPSNQACVEFRNGSLYDYEACNFASWLFICEELSC